jgi:predicted DNA-binding protein (MmcQ/YjbR family)
VATDLRRAEKALRTWALHFPESYEDHPWGENVAKVNKKVFVFFGTPQKDRLVVGVKLPHDGEYARSLPFCQPSGYGLGKAGWVTASFGAGDDPPLDTLKDWIDESYRAVAPKRLVKQLPD